MSDSGQYIDSFRRMSAFRAHILRIREERHARGDGPLRPGTDEDVTGRLEDLEVPDYDPNVNIGIWEGDEYIRAVIKEYVEWKKQNGYKGSDEDASSTDVNALNTEERSSDAEKD